MVYKTKPYRHQKEAFDRVYGLDAFALFMEQGTGKTKVTIDIAANLYSEGLITWMAIIAPNGVHDQWVSEQLEIHCPVEYKGFAYHAAGWNTKKKQKDLASWHSAQGMKVLAINVEAFQSESFMETLRDIFRKEGSRCFAVVDESTRIKSPKAKRSKNIQAFGKACAYRAILTGTPVTNSPFDLWSQMEFLAPNFFGCNYFIFTHRYGILIKQSSGNRTYHRAVKPGELRSVRSYYNAGKAIEDISYIMKMSESSIRYIMGNPELERPYMHLDELKEMIQPVSFTVKKEDCLDLPDKIFERIPVEMSKEQQKAYNELKKTYLAICEGKELSIDNKLTLSLRLQQITGGFFPYQVDENGVEVKDVPPAEIPPHNVKVKRLLEDLEEIGDERVIIWAQFRSEIKAIRSAIEEAFSEWKVATYYGETPTKNRAQIREAFQNGDIKVLIAHPKSAGTGLNLQRATLHYFYSNGFSLEDRLQAEDRSHRIGQHHPVVYKDLYATGTIDERIALVLADRRDVLEYFRDESADKLF